MGTEVGKKSGKPRKNNNKPGKRNKKKKNISSFGVYFNRILESIEKHDKTRVRNMSSKAKVVMDSFVYDIIDRLARQAARVAEYRKKITISDKDIETATKILLDCGLSRHSTEEGRIATVKYKNSWKSKHQ